MAHGPVSFRRILYAEDDENDVFFLRYAFREAGIHEPIQIVRDGQEAIDYLAGQGAFNDRKKFPLPCLVLLDLKLPRVDGMEVLAWIRSQRALRSLVVIMFTSSHHPLDIDRAYELGVNSFVVKPTTVEERLHFARYLNGWWLQQNQFAALFEGHPVWDAQG
jgi:CheY-like chemotaxis protein